MQMQVQVRRSGGQPLMIVPLAQPAGGSGPGAATPPARRSAPRSGRAALAVVPDPADADTDALIMGGTTMPTPSPAWQRAVLADYADHVAGGHYTPVLVATPESGASTSFGDGLADLKAAMARQQRAEPGRPYLVVGFSQSAVIAVNEKIELLRSGAPVPPVTFLLLGSLNRPNGGLLERFVGLDLPGTAIGLPDTVGFDFDGAEPTDGDIPTIDIANQYDFFADFPQFPVNALAVLNAVFGIIYAHASYGGGAVPGVPAVWPPSAPLTGPFTDGYTPGSAEVIRQSVGDTTFYFVPTTELPLLDPLRSLGVPERLLDIVQPALQVLIEAGYDRTVGFGEPTRAQLIPVVDPVTLGVALAAALVAGAGNAAALLGAALPGQAGVLGALAAIQHLSTRTVGAPYRQAVTRFNAAVNPIAEFAAAERPIGEAVAKVLNRTGIQGKLLNPVLSLIGTLGGRVTS